MEDGRIGALVRSWHSCECQSRVGEVAGSSAQGPEQECWERCGAGARCALFYRGEAGLQLKCEFWFLMMLIGVNGGGWVGGC